MPEGLSGSKDVACMERSAKNLGEPVDSCRYVGRAIQSKKRTLDDLQAVGLPDSTLRRESRSHGAACNKYTQPTKETLSGLQDWRK